MSAQRHLPGLNSLRFWAAIVVVAHHTEQIKNMFGLPNAWRNPFISEMGSFAVTFFFVLSGFLITYLLLVEREATGTIGVIAFYRRRALRILPLYALIVLLAFFVLPKITLFDLPSASPFPESTDTNFGRKLTLFAAMLPNLAILQMPPVAYASHLWSVGVEEQFYLLWPLLLLTGRLWAMALVVVVFMYLSTVSQFFYLTRMGCMALGGIAAWLLLKRFPIANLPAVALSMIFMGVGLFAYPFHYAREELVGAGFALFIANVAAGKIRVSMPATESLGTLSYGIYMFHIAGVVAAVKLFPDCAFPAAAIITVLIAFISYNAFEKPFLSMRYKGQMQTNPATKRHITYVARAFMWIAASAIGLYLMLAHSTPF